MDETKNNKIRDLTVKILDDPSEIIPTDLIRDLVDTIIECEFYVPVKDKKIVFFGNDYYKHIPICCDLKDFENVFEDATPEIFNFEYLKDFIDNDVMGFVINLGSRPFILNKYLAELAFNKNRPKQKVTKGYDVKVRLNDFRPHTWRDLIIPDNITFMELDDILKTLWGFNGHHLSCFLLKKNNGIIIDDDLSNETMMDMDYNANTTKLNEIFDYYDKITYWYDWGDDWQFDIEIKHKIDYDKDYVTIKRFKGKYNPVEDCGGTYGFSEIIECYENPENADDDFSPFVDGLQLFDMELSQLELERKAYTKSNWHRDVYFKK